MGDRKSDQRRRRDLRRRASHVPKPTHPATGRLRAVTAAFPCAVLAVLVSACTNEQVISVDIATVKVTPPSASAIEGEDVQLTATVLDENELPLEGATVTWTSQDTSIVSVDSNGTVHARDAGVTNVRAAFRDVWGAATVRVLPGPEIVLSRDSVSFFGGAGGAPPETEVVQVTNAGGASLEGVSIRVDHPPEAPAEWLDAALDDTTLPATLTLTAHTERMPVGAYAATVTVTAPAARNSPVSIPVTLSLTGFTVQESDGATSVSESGDEDTFTVVLDLMPTSDVVLRVTSEDAGEIDVSPRTLTFEPDAWDAPRTVTVEGVDDDLVDGPQVTLITIAVDEGKSDEVFEGLPDRTVSVSTADDDASSFTVVESDGSTSVDERGTRDELFVELTARPASDVTIDLVSADPSEVVVAPASLTFTPASWDDERTVTVTGVDDAQLDGEQMSDVTFSVNADESDDLFDGVADQTVTVRTTDDDVAGFTVTESGGTSVTEAGSTDGFSVVLTTRPSSEVVLTVTSADVGEATVDPAALTFTPASWNSERTVSVRGVDDAADDGNQVTEVRISIDPAASDGAFDAVADRTVDMTTVDDDDAGLTVRESGGRTSVTEAGSTDDLTVVLDAQPLSNVVVDVASGDAGEASVSPAALTFTPASWAAAQTVTVTGVDDPTADGHQSSGVTLSVRTGASDPSYASVPDQTLSVTTTDDDVAGFTITESGGTSVTEAGGTDGFTVVLTTQPAANVVLTVTNGDPGEATVSPGAVAFTPTNWNAARAVTITGVDDPAADGDQVTTLTVAVDDSGSDGAFDGVADQTVGVTTVDDDVAGFTVAESGGATVVTEAGGTDDVTVVLLAQPASNVVLTLSVSDPGEATVDPATLTFTPAAWSAPQTVTVTGADDPAADGDQVTTVTVAVDATGSDDAFDGVADQAVSMTTTNDDVAGFTVTESGGTTVVTEAGGTDDLTFVLLAQPASNVVLTLGASAPGEATVSPLALTFTPAAWNTPQAVTITGADDLAPDGDQGTTITVAVSDAASDDAFDAVVDQTVGVTTLDDDPAGFTVTQSGGTTVVTEAGGTDDLTVVLLAQPASNVVLSFTASDPGEATVSPRTLTFTPAAWNAPQIVTVTGVGDLLLDGDQVSTITVAVDAAASDDAFDGVADQMVSVTTTDVLGILGGGASALPAAGAPAPAYRSRSTAIASPYE